MKVFRLCQGYGAINPPGGFKRLLNLSKGIYIQRYPVLKLGVISFKLQTSQIHQFGFKAANLLEALMLPPADASLSHLIPSSRFVSHPIGHALYEIGYQTRFWKTPDVVVHKDAIQGIGGTSDTCIHSVRVNLLNPSKSTAAKPVIAWNSVLEKAPFVDKLESPYGLIGMDIIREWKELKLEPAKKGGLWIKIGV